MRLADVEESEAKAKKDDEKDDASSDVRSTSGSSRQDTVKDGSKATERSNRDEAEILY